MINKDELIFVVDEQNNPVESKPRSKVHQNGLWHRVSHIWVTNSQKQVLCQRRSLLKDTSPGKWEAFFGGHLAPGTEYLDGAVLELNEELGLEITKQDLKQILIFKDEIRKEFQGVFLLIWDGEIEKINFEEAEIDQLKWVNLGELKEVLNSQDPNWTQMGYEKEAFKFINQHPKLLKLEPRS